MFFGVLNLAVLRRAVNGLYRGVENGMMNPDDPGPAGKPGGFGQPGFRYVCSLWRLVTAVVPDLAGIRRGGARDRTSSLSTARTLPLGGSPYGPIILVLYQKRPGGRGVARLSRPDSGDVEVYVFVYPAVGSWEPLTAPPRRKRAPDHRPAPTRDSGHWSPESRALQSLR